MSDKFESFRKEPGGREIKLALQQKSSVEMGMEGDKGLAGIIVKRGRSFKDARKTGDMFFKEGMNVERVLKIYNLLKSKFKEAKEDGQIDYIPLVPTLRANGERIVMTDMTEGGRKIIVDRHTSDYKNRMSLPKGFRIKNFGEIEDQVRRINQIAQEAEIYLSFDAYSVVLDRRTWVGRVFLIDLGHVMPYSDPHYSVSDKRGYNRERADNFIEFLNMLVAGHI